MSALVEARPISPETVEKVLIGGDLAKLSPVEKTNYFMRVCDSLGLNHLTQPFAYIKLNGKEVLYAKRDATDQLRRVHRVSVKIVSREQLGDVWVVTAQATTPDGRTDESVGAVPTQGLKGDALANALMKCETKAKRRVTLSICGLGMLDETEVDTIPREAEPVANPLKEVREEREAVAADPGKYVADFGKYNGTAIEDIDMYALDGYLRYLHEGQKKSGKPMTGKVLKFVECAEAHLAMIETRAQQYEAELERA